MTDKELLEEAKEWRNDLLLTLVTTDLSDDLKKYTRKYKEILNGLIEQAERVQELEELVEGYKIELMIKDNAKKRANQQNKRYREALEFYANKINYLTFIENGKSNIEHDQGEKARKALEGEE